MEIANKLLSAVFCALFFGACSNDICRIDGTVGEIPGRENISVLIVESRTSVDTVSVVDGKFSIVRPIDDSKMLSAMVACDGRPFNPKYSVLFVADSKKVKIVLDSVSTVAGSPLSDQYRRLREESMEILKSGGSEAFLEYSKQAFKDNCSTIIGEKIFQGIVRDLSVGEIDEFIAMGTENMKQSESYRRIRADKVAEAATAVGVKYADFSGTTPDGKPVSLSAYVGKSRLTLVDFWASWCGPCMRSMPGMVRLWDRWHGKGLGIVGVAVWDGDNSASRVKVREMGMAWPQIFVGNDRSATELYGIAGIPHVLLIDAEGTIIYRGAPDEAKIESIVEQAL